MFAIMSPDRQHILLGRKSLIRICALHRPTLLLRTPSLNQAHRERKQRGWRVLRDRVQRTGRRGAPPQQGTRSSTPTERGSVAKGGARQPPLGWSLRPGDPGTVPKVTTLQTPNSYNIPRLGWNQRETQAPPGKAEQSSWLGSADPRGVPLARAIGETQGSGGRGRPQGRDAHPPLKPENPAARPRSLDFQLPARVETRPDAFIAANVTGEKPPPLPPNTFFHKKLRSRVRRRALGVSKHQGLLHGLASGGHSTAHSSPPAPSAAPGGPPAPAKTRGDSSYLQTTLNRNHRLSHLLEARRGLQAAPPARPTETRAERSIRHPSSTPRPRALCGRHGRRALPGRQPLRRLWATREVPLPQPAPQPGAPLRCSHWALAPLERIFPFGSSQGHATLSQDE